MSVLIQMCFIQVVGGYVNVAQISRINQYDPNRVEVEVVGSATERQYTGDATSAAFLKRIHDQCGGK